MTLAARVVLALFVGACLTVPAAAQGPKELATRTGVLWAPYQSWTLTLSGVEGNPFDVVANAAFDHADGGARHVTQLFYEGDGRWTFRFTGTRTGRWTVTTSSDHAALDGWRGEVVVEPNPDPKAQGFLTTAGGRFAAPVDEAGALAARQYHVYIDAATRNSLSDYPTEPRERDAAIDAILDDVDAHGMDALFVAVNHGWFAFGAESYADHDSVDPSLTSFAVLEALILRAHARGLSVHIWAWGDEERRWTPIGVGGIDGEADRRLQRYIAARLGPLPGWTMSYGFDLDEWVTPEQARAWWAHLHDHLGWPHLLMARESASTVDDPARIFRFEGAKLDVFSSDERPQRDFYAAAVAALEASDLPVLFERRFVHTRDGVWDMDTTRRAIWQFTLAGGVGAVWGPLWDGSRPYPEPAQLRTHRTFWAERWSLDLERPPEPIDLAYGYVLRDAAGTRTVVYAEATATVRLDLAPMAGAAPAVAVDTRLPYAEIAIGPLAPAVTAWTAPYASDWVVAVGDF